MSEEALLSHLQKALSPERIRVRLTRNRSVYLSTRRRAGALEVRASRLFLRGNDEVWNALAAYCRRPSPANRKILGSFFSSIPNEVIQKDVRSVKKMCVSGKVHDLKVALSRSLGLGFPQGFPGKIPSLGWSRKGTGKGVHRLGSYERGSHVVRIHPSLDDAEVPIDFVAAVIFHELLHVLYPPVMGSGGRWMIHSRIFKRTEMSYPHHAWSRSWEKKFLDTILLRQRKRAGAGR